MVCRIRVVRWVEGVLAFYACCVGILFLSYPSALTAAVYAPWRESGLAVWGTWLILSSVLHAVALWLNGHRPFGSRAARALACLSHIYVSLSFASFFWEVGAPWGVLTFLILIPGIIAPIFFRSFSEGRSLIIYGR